MVKLNKAQNIANKTYFADHFRAVRLFAFSRIKILQTLAGSQKFIRTVKCC